MDSIVSIILLFALLRLSLRVVVQDRRLAVIRSGKPTPLRGPGVVFIIPFLERSTTLSLEDQGVMLSEQIADFSGLPVLVSSSQELEPGTVVQISAFDHLPTGSVARIEMVKK